MAPSDEESSMQDQVTKLRWKLRNRCNAEEPEIQKYLVSEQSR